ncbi:cytadherence high molecular weight protein 3-like isoform X1 [Cotesia glomerata]|nr:cytadherence high molecular weight protein 3-like isoform X1 [Cotesia glomerata]
MGDFGYNPAHIYYYNHHGFLVEFYDNDSEEDYYDSEEEVYFDQLDDAAEPNGIIIEDIFDQPDYDEDVYDQPYYVEDVYDQLPVEENGGSDYEDSYDTQDDVENVDLPNDYVEDLSYHDANDVPEYYDDYISDNEADYWENYQNDYESSSYYVDSDDYFSD